MPRSTRGARAFAGSRAALVVLASLASAASGVESAYAEAGAVAVVEDEAGCEACDRPRATGSWGGRRDRVELRGLRFDLDATYTFQGLAAGGLRDPFAAASGEDRTGNTFSSELTAEIDTRRLGLWRGGSLRTRVEGRAGESMALQAGTVAPVANDPLYPNVVDAFDDPVIAFTELVYTQSIGAGFALSGGLMNTAEGDANELAGSALSNEHFLNSGLLYSLVEDATVPHVALGGAILYEPSDRIAGSFSIFGSSETAGTNPFEDWNGTTFSTEWSLAHELKERAGSQTLGFLYGIDARRTDIATNPRVAIGSILSGLPVPTTTADSWSIYYNAHQFLAGGSDGGVGVFVRFGASDGNPNAVHWNFAAGLGGSGLLPFGAGDRFGLGFFYLGMSDQDLLQGLGVDDEYGGELFYSFGVTPWLHLTADAQVVKPALPVSDTAVVFALRARLVL